MMRVVNIKQADFNSIPIDAFWNTGEEKEHKMHRIHAYPAKFPAFITSKALDFATDNNLQPLRIADVFCGCGTVAYEAKRSGIHFWGCDINPVATMIARAKSRKYQSGRLRNYNEAIIKKFLKLKYKNSYDKANDRLQYWYSRGQYDQLYRLKSAIEKVTPETSDYRLFFICAFSNILKSTSGWLQKSIKPQIDPNKQTVDVLTAFIDQCKTMIKANDENDITGESITEIITGSFLDESVRNRRVDMIITSPPYVTSYEYADLHQLSSLWLGYVDDYRELREGSIGSRHHEYNFERELKHLNDIGSGIVFRLLDQHKSKARFVAKYFLDIQQVAKACYDILTENGMALFIIGNTEYKGVQIDNARHLAQSLITNGFKELLVTKRKISGKNLTPFRDENGCFTNDKNGRQIYSEEFILIGKK